MASLPIVGGCVLINDIFKINNYTGGRKKNKQIKSSKTNNRFEDLGIPVGYISIIKNNRANNKNSIHNIVNENHTYVDTLLFDYFVKRSI